ncbi:hypothetical protein CSUB01_11575 [Colletotrichum sublineola]|uniref:Uncharacterized protein n=1 Tax=Colletotrichum sublineola TaxID=1173701 RepID=A0A066XJB0_COLSU|nr:hypothetical protein CSUB01_11575 [Colletotrichum sublineola]
MKLQNWVEFDRILNCRRASAAEKARAEEERKWKELETQAGNGLDSKESHTSTEVSGLDAVSDQDDEPEPEPESLLENASKKRKRAGESSKSPSAKKPRTKRPVDACGKPILQPGPYRIPRCLPCLKSIVHGSSWGECVKTNKGCVCCQKNHSQCIPVLEALRAEADRFVDMVRARNASKLAQQYASKKLREKVDAFDLTFAAQKKSLKKTGLLDPNIPAFGAPVYQLPPQLSYITQPSPDLEAKVQPHPPRKNRSETSALVDNARVALWGMFSAAAGQNTALLPAFESLLALYEKAV